MGEDLYPSERLPLVTIAILEGQVVGGGLQMACVVILDWLPIPFP